MKTLFTGLLLLVVGAFPIAAGGGDALEPGWYARIETEMGTVIAKLLPEQAPQAVAHFAALAQGTFGWKNPISEKPEKGHYYDKSPISRAVAGQRFEAGDRTGTGVGAPRIFIPREGFGPVNFGGAGRLGMARDGMGPISGVKFFVTATAAPWLNRRHPCFGIVVSDLETVFRITEVKTEKNGRPLKPVSLERVRIFSVGSPEPLPEPVPFTPEPRRFKMTK